MTIDLNDWLDTHPGDWGWRGLVTELDEKLRQRWPNYTIHDIKEKFGTLRFYADPNVSPPDIAEEGWDAGLDAYEQWRDEHVIPFQALIREYEHRSESICELCGKPGRLGVNRSYWCTRCPNCAPATWNAVCEHPNISNFVCEDCGQENIAKLEHTDLTIIDTHPPGRCFGRHCTLHNRSNHTMRSFPQHWRSDKGMMERICPHGVGHPDPDEYLLTTPQGQHLGVHGCDGCCTKSQGN